MQANKSDARPLNLRPARGSDVLHENIDRERAGHPEGAPRAGGRQEGAWLGLAGQRSAGEEGRRRRVAARSGGPEALWSWRARIVQPVSAAGRFRAGAPREVRGDEEKFSGGVSDAHADAASDRRDGAGRQAGIRPRVARWRPAVCASCGRCNPEHRHGIR